MIAAAPHTRVRVVRDVPLRRDRAFVLYWMTSARRTRWSFALDHALHHARELGLPLVVLEALRCDYPWASDRFHRFVLDGMRQNQGAFDRAGIVYHPYIEPAVGAGKGLLEALAGRAALVVTDDFPTYFLPRMVAAAGARLDTRLEAIDGNGMLPLSASGKTFPTAYVFRRFMQKTLPAHLAMPAADPLADHGTTRVPDLLDDIVARWPAASPELLEGSAQALASLPVDHSVGITSLRGGPDEAARMLSRFLIQRLSRYGEERHLPDAQADSQLSPYLHFGHLSMHEVVAGVFAASGRPFLVEPGRATGQREGFWGLPASAESFLDEAITWRELGYHSAAHDPTFGTYASVPGWARQSLAKHASDPRARHYSVEELAQACSNDEVWNAAQTQLLREGRIHNAVRMVWGKKVLEWTRDGEEAFATLVELNNRYALDGRNPNSYSGISWCLGKFDRPWGPERPIFGVVRYMTTESARRKYKLKDYIARNQRDLFQRM